MPRPPKNTPTVFDAEETNSSAPARPDGNAPIINNRPAGSQPADGKGAERAGDSTAAAPPPVADAPPVGAETERGLVERRKIAEKEAEKFLRRAVQFVGHVATGSKKITVWTNVGDRLRAAERIIELSAGKNPVADQLDKGRPMLLIARSAVRPGTEHVLPPDYTPPKPMSDHPTATPG